MSYEAEDTYDVYNERRVKARKPRPCDACKETVPRGVHYWRVATLYDGRWTTINRCWRCQKIHLHLRDRGDATPDYLWPDERLNCGEEYRDHWGDDPPEEIAALAFALPGDVG